jgi:dienelactone hydrolase
VKPRARAEPSYEDLASYSDWVTYAERTGTVGWSPTSPATRRDHESTRAKVLEVLGANGPVEEPASVRVEARWEADGIEGRTVTWDVGYGPRTEAYVLKPAGVPERLPGVVALHCHGNFKYYGKEKIADGPQGAAPGVEEVRSSLYGERAYANALAREGFVVLVPDVFTWGSRRFALNEPSATGARAAGPSTERTAGAIVARGPGAPGGAIASYNAAAERHEHVVEKYCRLLGTSFAEMVAREDRMALSFLISLPEVDSGRVGCIGLSGGGLRAGMLHAACEEVSAAVVVAMMTTYGGLLDHNVAGHTWMLYPAGWPAEGDWPDLVGCRPHSPMLVQYDLDDELFSPKGMHDADRRLRSLYESAGNPGGYTGQFYAGPHKFDRAMQDAAFAWLSSALRRDQ